MKFNFSKIYLVHQHRLHFFVFGTSTWLLWRHQQTLLQLLQELVILCCIWELDWKSTARAFGVNSMTEQGRERHLSSYHTKCFGLSNSDKPHKITETREGRPSISLTWFKHGANALEVNFISDSPITLINEITERHQQNNFNLNKKCKFGTNNVTRNMEN